MKLTIHKDSFLAAFGAVAPALPRTSPLVALQSALLVAGEGGVRLTASNAEQSITCDVPGVTVAEGGSVLLPERFHQILRASDAEELGLAADGAGLVVKGRGSRHAMPVGDAATYPLAPEFGHADHFRLGAAALKKGIRLTAFVTTEKSTNFTLGGVLFEAEAGRIVLAAYDGSRLALFDLEAAAEGEPKLGSPSVPAKALRLLERQLEDDAPAVDFAADANSAWFRCGGTVVWTRLCHGRFPAYKRAFDLTWADRATFPAGALREAIQEAAVMASEESRGVSFRFDAGSLKIATMTADVGESEVEREVAWAGESKQVVLDSRFALAPLQVLGADDEVSVGVIDGRSLVLFESGRNRHYIAPLMTKQPQAQAQPQPQAQPEPAGVN